MRNQLDQAMDWNRVLEQISQYASFSCSKEEIRQAMPQTEMALIRQQLSMAQECMELDRQGSLLDFSGCTDIQDYVTQAQKQSPLEPKELLDVANFLAACRNIRQFFEDQKESPCGQLAETIDDCARLRNNIFDAVDATGDIKDNASSTLKHAIKQLGAAKQKVSNRAASFIKSHSSQLMESVSTSVQGRVCVLVKAQYKNQFGGLIHGQSQSGLAFYVEPNAFVDDNNAVQSARLEIEEEKARICRRLSKEVGDQAEILLSDLDTMTQLDVAWAKGKWAARKDGCIPLIQTQDRSFLFEQARHPLLDEKTVIANTYECKDDCRCVMLSGPNMGGKTVTLKTVGLFVLLAASGFPVLAHRAKLPVFTSWYFDIGDQQSIENNLSTFSSHIANISSICQQADEYSFVLLDEPGNGTDPAEGACLAQAILEYLIDKGCTVLTSTHYQAVKTFAKTHPQILVSSMEFDQETLKPTYRYLPGVSGASYAFDVAKLYDLDASVLERAALLKEENMQDVDKKMEELESLQFEVIQEKERFDALIQDAHRIQKEAVQAKEKAEKEKEELDTQYREELDAYLSEKKEQAKEIIRDLRQSGQQKVHQQIEKMHQLEDIQEPRQEKESQYTFHVGDYVFIDSMNQYGEITDLRKKKAQVSVGAMSVQVNTNQLSPAQKPKPKMRTQSVQTHTRTRVPMELNVIGYRVEEGVSAVQDYIDQAVAHHMSQVRIIHGVGTGALRSAIWNELKHHGQVDSYQSGGEGEGGLGATIVKLK